jgi:hypothetical protein
MIENPSWLARILKADGTTAGTGIAIDHRHIITCAHLSAGPGGQSIEEGQMIRLEFPFASSDGRTVFRDTNVVLDAHAICSKLEDRGSADFAVLELPVTVTDLTPPPLRRVSAYFGRKVIVRGFPWEAVGQSPDAVMTLSGFSRPGWVQLNPDAARGWTVDHGFSGGPVWDMQMGAVIGMTVTRSDNGSGDMITLDLLAQMWPDLRGHLDGIPVDADSHRTPGKDNEVMSSPVANLQTRPADLNSGTVPDQKPIVVNAVEGVHIHFHFHVPAQPTNLSQPSLNTRKIRTTQERRVGSSDRWCDYWFQAQDESQIVSRESEMQIISDAFAEIDNAPAPAFSIAGMGGIGKTSLALTFADQNQHRFEGRVFFDFRSGGSVGKRLTAPHALRQILPMVGSFAPEEVDQYSDQRLIGAWRAITTGRSLLMIWDNIDSIEQIAPLIVHRKGCATITTSRRAIAFEGTGIVGRVHSMNPALTSREASDLFGLIAGQGFQRELVEEILKHSMNLPILIKLHARSIASGRSFESVFADLSDSQRPWWEDEYESKISIDGRLNAAFDRLTREAKLAYLALGSHPGGTVTVASIAVMTNSDVERTKTSMEELVASGICNHDPGDRHGSEFGLRRYEAHDLIRLHATEMAKRGIGISGSAFWDHTAATQALILHYQDGLQKFADDQIDWFIVESDSIRKTACSGNSIEHQRLALIFGQKAMELGELNQAAEALEHAVRVFDSDKNSTFLVKGANDEW